MTISAAAVAVEIDGKCLLNDVSLCIEPGQIIAVVGPNGAGKSTLIAAIAGDITPTEGIIRYHDSDLQTLSFLDRAAIRSVMAQSQSVVYDFSVLDIIAMGWVRGRDGESARQFGAAVSAIVEECAIAELLGRTFNSLSGGEQRRVHFARALMQLWRPRGSANSAYLLLDEPTANLDLAHEVRLLKKLTALAADGIGILLVVHDLNIAAKFADKIALLHSGRMTCIGAPKDVLTAERLSKVFEIPISIDPNPLTIKYY